MNTRFSGSIHRGKDASRRPALDPSSLDELAGAALTFLAADPERLDRFFAVTGLSVETLREAAGTPAFVSHLVGYIAADERRLLAFATETGRDPAAIESVRAALDPGDG